MADDKERARIFRRQTKELLDSQGSRSIKEALAVFMEDKDVPMLVATLQGILDTPEKEALFESIGWFIPEHFLADYRVHAHLDGSENGHADDDIDGSDGGVGEDLDVLAIANAEASRKANAPIVRGIPPPELPPLDVDDEKSEESDTGDYDDATGYTMDAAPGAAATAAPTAQPMSFAAAAEQHSTAADTAPTEEFAHVFGSQGMQATEQAADTGDTHGKETAESGFYIELDPDVDDGDEEVREETSHAHVFDDRDPVRPQDITTSMRLEHSPVVSTSGFLVGDISRQEAEDIIIENGISGGAFLVRKKSNPSDGSFKLRPGQQPPSASWALSFVQHSLAFSHQLIVQQRPGAVLVIGGKELGRTTRLPDLIEFLRTQAGYELTRSPYQSQPWYHGSITREDAESRLRKTPVPGRFLVRRSLRESRTVVISIVGDNSCIVHYRATFTGAGWIAQKYPRFLYDTVFDLLIANCGQFGFQLTSHCARPKASGGFRRR
eukprot:m.22141 g.22141  ORF g.22141 m.22141 type:complete len:495 (-) comp12638_c0_seq1:3980-5464(-)